MSDTYPGYFITFEGGEGSGKTTQINKLAQRLTEAGHKVLTTREPGGTPEAEKIRDLMVRRGAGNLTPMAEVLLVFAARVLHVDQVIKPALAEGRVVICDRFTDSTRAYQGYGHGVDLAAIEAINDTVLGGFSPDLTFVLDITAQEGLARAEKRLTSESYAEREAEDRFEQLAVAFHERLRQGFLTMAKDDPTRCMILDAARTVEELASDILDEATQRLKALEKE